MLTPQEILINLIEDQPDDWSSEEIVSGLLPYTTGKRSLPGPDAWLDNAGNERTGRRGVSWEASRKLGLKMSEVKDAYIEAIEQQPGDSMWEHLTRELLVFRTIRRAGNWTESNSAKDEILRLISDLPDDVCLDEIAYHVSIFTKLRDGIQASKQGRVLTQEEAKRLMAEWLTK